MVQWQVRGPHTRLERVSIVLCSLANPNKSKSGTEESWIANLQRRKQHQRLSSAYGSCKRELAANGNSAKSYYIRLLWVHSDGINLIAFFKDEV